MTRTLMLLAGAAALASAAPALAKPGKGHKHHGNHVSGLHYGCPPGLAKKGCMPPGQARKMFRVGQRFQSGYGTRWSYNQIPYSLRTQYDFDRYDRYYYGDGYLYQVDPRTLLVERVVSALLR